MTESKPNTAQEKDELSEIIAKVHDSIEGRYTLDSYDEGIIHWFLCKLQSSQSLQKENDQLKAEVERLKNLNKPVP